MLQAASKTWRSLVAGAALLGLATGVAAQGAQTKETVPVGPATVKTVQVKGELVAKGSHWIVARPVRPIPGLRRPGRKAIVDGVAAGPAPLGTMLTSTATTTVTPMVNRTTTITRAPSSGPSPRHHRDARGGDKQYCRTVSKFNVDGKARGDGAVG
jgi:hypothetical protein